MTIWRRPKQRRSFALFASFAERHTKAYLYQTGQARRVPICPINTPWDILTSRQLEYRSFYVWQETSPSGRMLTSRGRLTNCRKRLGGRQDPRLVWANTPPKSLRDSDMTPSRVPLF